MYTTSTILQFLVSGVATGCIYGLVAIGFSVIFNASGIVNFAQGAFVMLGGTLTYLLYQRAHLPLPVAAALAVLLTAVVGLGFERLIIRPLWQRRSSVFIMMLATLALSVVSENAVLHLVGDEPRSFPAFTAGGPIRLGGVAIGLQILWIVGGSIVLVVLLTLLYRQTLLGKAMRACAINREVASLLAIPVERMLAWSFALSAALGAVGGILITPTQYTAYHIAVPFSVSGFIAAILGGLGNPVGAFAGGILLGVLQSLAILFFDAGYKDIVAFTILVLFLFLRPAGLFGSLVEE
jgi:branched-chain amino acid transport system permease protein